MSRLNFMRSRGQALDHQAAQVTLAGVTLSRAGLGRVFGLFAIAAMWMSGLGFRWQPGQFFEIPYAGWNWMLAGAVLLGAAVWLLKPTIDFFQVAQAENAERVVYKIGWRGTLAGITLLVIFAGVNGHPALRLLPVSSTLQMLLFVGGVGSLAWGMGGFQIRRWSGSIRLDWALLFLMALGLCLRLWGVGDMVHMMIDELHFTAGVVDLRAFSDQRLLDSLNDIARFSYFYSYFQNGLMQLPGVDFFTGMRLLSVIIGTLTIPAVYGLGHALFDRRMAWFAAAVLTLFPAHIHFSRLAMNNIADPLFGALAFAGLAWGLRYRSQKAFVLGGVCLGLTSYFYEGGRLVFLGLAISWLALVIVANRPRRQLRGLLLFGLAALLVALPYYYSSGMTSSSGTPRFDAEGVRLRYIQEGIQTDGLSKTLELHWREGQGPAIYHTIYSPDESQFYYGGHTGIIPWYVVPFYLLGLFYLLWRCRSAGALLLLWLVGGLAGIGLIVSTDWTVRFVVLFPAMALVIAAGMRYPLAMIWPERGRRALAWMVVGILLVTSAAGLWHYYGEHMTVYNRQLRAGLHDFAAAQERAGELAPDALLVYITPEYVHAPVLNNYIALRYPDMEYILLANDDLLEENLSKLPLNRNLAFALEPTFTLDGTLEMLRGHFWLTGPYFSSYPSVPLDRQYFLYLYQPLRTNN